MFFGKPTRAKNVLFAVLSFTLSGMMFHSWATFDGIPARAALQTASGRVSWVEDGRYGVKFGLEGVSRSFDYASKGNAADLVRDALSRPDRPVVTVLYDPDNPGGPIYSNDTYHGVFELSVDGKPLRRHADVDAAWRSDENVAAWLAFIFALLGLYLTGTAFRRRHAG